MEYPSQLIEGILLKRHNRFLADVVLDGEDKRLISCEPEGYLKGCDVLGSRVWFRESPTTYQNIWELVEVDGGHLVSVNEHLSAQLVHEGIEEGTVVELLGYSHYQFNQPFGLEEGSVVDLLLQSAKEKCYVITQDVTLGDEIGRGFYPDGIQIKAAQELRELIRVVNQGHRAVLFYCVKHTGVHTVYPAPQIDLQYAALLQDALDAGVEMMAYKTDITLANIHLNESIPVKCLYQKTPQ